LSTLPRTSLVVAALLLAGCSPEQSKNVGDQPKKTMDRASSDVNKAMQQGAERVKEESK
jgi:PBP1b-binding outer membrane lipoprotein LpoB